MQEQWTVYSQGHLELDFNVRLRLLLPPGI